jgi:hypothetical protein
LTALLCLPAGLASAKEAEPEVTTVYRLSPDEIAETQDPEQQRIEELALIDNQLRDRSIHGEVGFSVGTGGYRSVFESAVIPLGDDGFLAVAFEQARNEYRQRRYHSAGRHHHR